MSEVYEVFDEAGASAGDFEHVDERPLVRIVWIHAKQFHVRVPLHAERFVTRWEVLTLLS